MPARSKVSILLGTMGVSIIIAAVALLVAAGLSWQVWRLQSRINRALGSTSGDLELALAGYHKMVKVADQKLDTLTTLHQELIDKAALASQKISIVRFNPFGDTGGDQSFVLAVLDDHNSGYVLTSIHGRGGTRVYVKPIDFGKSKYNLSTEEQQALMQATKRTHKKESA